MGCAPRVGSPDWALPVRMSHPARTFGGRGPSTTKSPTSPRRSTRSSRGLRPRLRLHTWRRRPPRRHADRFEQDHRGRVPPHRRTRSPTAPRSWRASCRAGRKPIASGATCTRAPRRPRLRAACRRSSSSGAGRRAARLRGVRESFRLPNHITDGRRRHPVRDGRRARSSTTPGTCMPERVARSTSTRRCRGRHVTLTELAPDARRLAMRGRGGDRQDANGLGRTRRAVPHPTERAGSPIPRARREPRTRRSRSDRSISSDHRVVIATRRLRMDRTSGRSSRPTEASSTTASTDRRRDERRDHALERRGLDRAALRMERRRPSTDVGAAASSARALATAAA